MQIIELPFKVTSLLFCLSSWRKIFERRFLERKLIIAGLQNMSMDFQSVRDVVGGNIFWSKTAETREGVVRSLGGRPRVGRGFFSLRRR